MLIERVVRDISGRGNRNRAPLGTCIGAPACSCVDAFASARQAERKRFRRPRDMFEKHEDSLRLPEIGMRENPQVGSHRGNFIANPDQLPVILGEITGQHCESQPGPGGSEHPVNRVHSNSTPINEALILQPTLESRICHAFVRADPVHGVQGFALFKCCGQFLCRIR